MARIFAGLAIGNVLVLIATAGFGLLSSETTPDRHILLAVFALLLTTFVQVLTFTYFTVTGKVIGQTVHLAGYDRGALDEVKKLKRAFTFTLLVMMLGVLIMTITGAVHWRTSRHAIMHMAASGAMLVATGPMFVRQFRLIVRNAKLMDEAVRAYDAWRSMPAIDRQSTVRIDRLGAASLDTVEQVMKLEDELDSEGGAGIEP